MKEDKQRAPLLWGSDRLSVFHQVATENQRATFGQRPEHWRLLSDLHDAMADAVVHCIGLTMTGRDSSGLLLFGTAVSHFRGAATLSTAGHCVAVYPTGRAALEAALYGWYLRSDQEAEARWHNKPEDDAKARREWGREFSFSSVCGRLAESQEELSARARKLHQAAIDFGGHPNADSLYTNMQMTDRPDGGVLIAIASLHPWGVPFAHAMKFACEVGLVIVELMVASDDEVAERATLRSRHAQFVERYRLLEWESAER